MGPSWGVWFIASLALVLGNALFVGIEYALVAARRSRIESLAKKGNKKAKALTEAFADMSSSVAGIQVAITMFGIGVGAVTEPKVRDALQEALKGSLPTPLVATISLLLVTFTLVVFGELVPKYLALRFADPVAMAAIRPLGIFIAALKPLVWASQRSAEWALRLLGTRPESAESTAVPKEELALLVRAGATEGMMEKTHAEVVARALNLDSLRADDIMVHRIDVKWLPAALSREELAAKVAEVPFTRIPVCESDLDEVIGILYLHDYVRHLGEADFDLRKILRPAVSIPENLTLDKIVATMRDEKTQMLVVTDEYGGTNGVVTLEDVVEEVFGELEDRLEGDRPAVEFLPNGRVSVKADVRMDELAAKLGLENAEQQPTDTLAETIVNALGRVPSVGDRVNTALGTIRVDNMARRRITRVSLLRTIATSD